MASSRGRWASPERTVVWTEPPPKTTSATTRRHAHAHAAPPAKVPVVYYLSRNGQLDHPHFMEVPVSNPQDGLCLRDVLDRLTVLRGAGMADAYSWSSKRSYKAGYVWHDLTADDPVHPASGAEYVLKGSELLPLLPAPPYPRDASAGSSSSSSTSSCQAGSENNKKMPAVGISRAHGRRKNWSSFDLGEYRVAAARGGAGADAATQTDERRGRRRGPEPTTELGADEISPPPSSSSPDTLETLINNDVRVAAASSTVAARRGEEDAGLAQQGVIAGGRMRASAVLMQLISCGSIPAAPKRETGPGGARYTAERRLPRGRSDLSSSTGGADGFSGSIGVGASMEREYFSGSLVETKKSASGDRAGHGGELGALKRSSSYNADRGRESAMITASTTTASGGCKMELAAEEVDGVRARCIPAGRKPSGGSSSSKKSPTTHVHVSSRRGDQQETTDHGRAD
ncbi:unnamed protein product [Triticum turgidum subsp. durum]|uniref:SOSEKI DIX-like domain-containing protein n=3 Tax=Triticum TaxID=4564 RepID=A0A9R1SAN1_TRITD|nr:unnamed protein product [Triticum turgidum subsp. durum]